MTGTDQLLVCAYCGETVSGRDVCWHMATPCCTECFTGPVCGDCSTDMGVFFDEWPAAVESGAELIPCAVCGKTGGQE